MKEKATNRNTTKKITVIGTEQYVNCATGNIENFNVIKSQDADFDFDKLWTAQILLAIDEFGNQKIKLLMHLIKIREKSNNAVIRTVAELAEETGMNRNTVSLTLQILQRHGVVTRKTGVVFISPNVIFRGSHSNRMRVLIEYQNVQKNQDETEIEDEPRQLKPATAADLAAIPGLAVKKKGTKVRIKPANAGV
jgi:DNA-binding transcriptional regulator YhcF (GntR family)